MLHGFKDTIKAHPRLYRPLRTLRFGLGGMLPPRRVPGIPGRIHRNDLMFAAHQRDSAADYYATGHQAAEFIDRALEQSGRSLSSIKSALDIGCGFGRVLRFLAAH